MWIFLFVIFLVEAAEHPSSMCNRKQTEDCSFQLLNATKNSCLFYNTSVCLNQFSNITKPGVKLSSELDSAFAVSIYPYTAVIYDISFSAINITIDILCQDITHVLVTIKYVLGAKENTINKTMCRILDFQGYSEGILIPTTFFYDCFYNLVENHIQNVWMTFKSMPMNEELNYYVFIPPAMTLESTSRWQPLVMIFCENLSKGIISIKFSQAPHTFNISSYSVNLVQEVSNKVINSKLVNFISQGKMTNVEFSSVDTGIYSIVITSMNMNGTKYFSTRTGSFAVTVHYLDKMLILYICIVFLLTLSLYSIVKCFRSFLYPDFPPKHVLLVYSFDCPEHEEFVSSFATYLTNACNMIVTTIYGIIGDPQQWIRDKYMEAEVIIFIISEGLFLTFEADSSSHPKFGTHWPKQLQDTVTYILHQIFNNGRSYRKKLCKVYFPYTSEKFVPECLGDDMGKCYELPKKFNNFLCFIFNCEPLIHFINFYPKLHGCQPLSSSVGREMLEKVKIMQMVVNNKSHLKNKMSIQIENNTENIIYSDTDKLSHSPCKTVNYEPVNSEDSESCDEIEFKCSNILTNDSDIENWVNYVKQIHSNSRNNTTNNHMIPFVEKDLFQ